MTASVGGVAVFEFNRAELWRTVCGSGEAGTRQDVQNVEVPKRIALRVKHVEWVLAAAQSAREDGLATFFGCERLEEAMEGREVVGGSDPVENVIQRRRAR